MRIGFTSVTFRSKTVQENVALAVAAGAAGIEWGGDVHVPPGDLSTARDARRRCDDHGLAVLSYGSYWRCKDSEDTAAVIRTASSLGAPVIRAWAYDKSPTNVTVEEFGGVVRNLQRLCREAADVGVIVGLEYHRDTLTETLAGTLDLIQAVGRNNLRTYWQPNPELSPEAHRREIDALLPWLANVHVFHWRREGGTDIRCPLREGRAVWDTYIAPLPRDGTDLILEFVKDDSEPQFFDDMNTLRSLRNT